MQEKHFDTILQSLDSCLQNSSKPFFIGIVGPSASGKSTLAEFLKCYLNKTTQLETSVIPLDNFIYSNDHLKQHDLMQQKGFPESFDHLAIKNFFSQLQQANQADYQIPFYSHDIKDIYPDRNYQFPKSDIYIFEGISLFYQYPDFCLADVINWSVYLDIDINVIKQRSIKRFLKAFNEAKQASEPAEFFKSLVYKSEQEIYHFAENLWDSIDVPTIDKYIKPQQQFATIVAQKLPNISELAIICD